MAQRMHDEESAEAREERFTESSLSHFQRQPARVPAVQGTSAAQAKQGAAQLAAQGRAPRLHRPVRPEMDRNSLGLRVCLVSPILKPASRPCTVGRVWWPVQYAHNARTTPRRSLAVDCGWWSSSALGLPALAHEARDADFLARPHAERPLILDNPCWALILGPTGTQERVLHVERTQQFSTRISD